MSFCTGGATTSGLCWGLPVCQVVDHVLFCINRIICSDFAGEAICPGAGSKSAATGGRGTVMSSGGESRQGLRSCLKHRCFDFWDFLWVVMWACVTLQSPLNLKTMTVVCNIVSISQLHDPCLRCCNASTSGVHKLANSVFFRNLHRKHWIQKCHSSLVAVARHHSSHHLSELLRNSHFCMLPELFPFSLTGFWRPYRLLQSKGTVAPLLLLRQFPEFPVKYSVGFYFYLLL